MPSRSAGEERIYEGRVDRQTQGQPRTTPYPWSEREARVDSARLKVVQGKGQTGGSHTPEESF